MQFPIRKTLSMNYDKPQCVNLLYENTESLKIPKHFLIILRTWFVQKTDVVIRNFRLLYYSLIILKIPNQMRNMNKTTEQVLLISLIYDRTIIESNRSDNVITMTVIIIFKITALVITCNHQFSSDSVAKKCHKIESK